MITDIVIELIHPKLICVFSIHKIYPTRLPGRQTMKVTFDQYATGNGLNGTSVIDSTTPGKIK